MIQIKHVVLEHEFFPIRWWLMDDNGQVYTIRERGGECVVHIGIKSIFDVTDVDVIADFEVEKQSDMGTLKLALDKIDAELLPGAMDSTIDEHFWEYSDDEASIIQRKRGNTLDDIL